MGDTLTRKIYGLTDLQNVCLELRPIILSKHYSIACLYGEMGAGKTTLVQCLLDGLIKTKVSSPTFNILNLYDGYNGEKYLHFDLYKKNHLSLEDLREIGMDILYENKNNHCFIEWPLRLMDLDENRQCINLIEIFIKKIDDSREITVNL